VTPSLPNDVENALGENPPTNAELVDEARKRLETLKIVTQTTKKTLTTVALLRFLGLDPRDHIDRELDPQIEAFLEDAYGSIVRYDANIEIHDCARCGGDHDAAPLDEISGRPIETDAGTHTHHALCPTTGDPILVRFEHVDEEEEEEDA
jgi:hypothetical protein